MIKTKTVQIASVPNRVDSLKKTVESIIDQVDFLFVALNLYEKTPDFLLGNRKISSALMDNKMSDSYKAYRCEEREGYVLFLDDDIEVGKHYVSTMCDAVDQYKCLVSLHGKVFRKPFRSFYHIEHNYRCLGNCPVGGYVDIIGSGVCCYHTDYFKLDSSKLDIPHMSDILISREAMRQGVKMYVIPHTDSFIKHTRFNDNLFVQENSKGFEKQTAILKEMFNA